MACARAAEHAKANTPLVLSILEQYRAGVQVSSKDQDEISKLEFTLDERYFALHETYDPASATYFEKARAIAALSFALKGDALAIQADAIYEAAMSFGDPDELVGAVLHALTTQ